MQQLVNSEVDGLLELKVVEVKSHMLCECTSPNFLYLSGK